MVRPAHAHPCATAHQPNLVVQKTHFGGSTIVWCPGLLARLVVFQVLFLSIVIAYRVLYMHETRLPRSSDSFERRGSAWFEMIFFNFSSVPPFRG